MDQTTIAITGATDGLGRGLAHALATEDVRLLLHGRDEQRGAQVLAECREIRPDIDVTFLRADFGSLEEVSGLADRLCEQERIDVLVNNAGIGVELTRRQSRDGHEMTFQVDYLASYLLGCRLLPKVAERSGRIVSVASAGQAPINFDDVQLERSWDGGQAYCQAKLAQIMFTFALAATTTATSAGTAVNALHPASYMPTKIVTHLFVPQSSLAEGVANLRALVRDRRWGEVTGQYVNRQTVGTAHAQAYARGARDRLIELSERLTGTALPA